MLMADARAESLLRSIERDVRASFTPDQEVAIIEAARRQAWNAHPVDIRFSVPLPVGRYHLTLVAGPERRSRARRNAERERRGAITAGNVCAITIAVAVGMLAALGLAVLLGGIFVV